MGLVVRGFIVRDSGLGIMHRTFDCQDRS